MPELKANLTGSLTYKVSAGDLATAWRNDVPVLATPLLLWLSELAAMRGDCRYPFRGRDDGWTLTRFPHTSPRHRKAGQFRFRQVSRRSKGANSSSPSRRATGEMSSSRERTCGRS